MEQQLPPLVEALLTFLRDSSYIRYENDIESIMIQRVSTMSPVHMGTMTFKHLIRALEKECPEWRTILKERFQQHHMRNL